MSCQTARRRLSPYAGSLWLGCVCAVPVIVFEKLLTLSYCKLWALSIPFFSKNFQRIYRSRSSGRSATAVPRRSPAAPPPTGTPTAPRPRKARRSSPSACPRRCPRRRPCRRRGSPFPPGSPPSAAGVGLCGPALPLAVHDREPLPQQAPAELHCKGVRLVGEHRAGGARLFQRAEQLRTPG